MYSSNVFDKITVSNSIKELCPIALFIVKLIDKSNDENMIRKHMYNDTFWAIA